MTQTVKIEGSRGGVHGLLFISFYKGRYRPIQVPLVLLIDDELRSPHTPPPPLGLLCAEIRTGLSQSQSRGPLPQTYGANMTSTLIYAHICVGIYSYMRIYDHI